jgi:hypothetical protein
MAIIENWSGLGDAHELRHAVDSIRSSTQPGDWETWLQLRSIIINPQIPAWVRIECFRIACEKADGRIAQDILAMMREWIDYLNDPHNFHERLAGGVGLSGDRLVLLAVFLEEETTTIERALGQHGTAGLEFLTAVATLDMPSIGLRYLALSALPKSAAPLELRRACAQAILTKWPGSAVLDELLASLLDSSCFERLRELVRASPDAEHFHFHAAAALAHFGDREIIPDLRTWQPRLAQASKNLAGPIERYIWQIEIQHPPSKLIEHIASVGGWPMREWAIQRAAELGLPKDEIRRAILTHAEKVEPVTEKKIKPGLTTIKIVGLRLGVLEPADLPEVRLPADFDAP